MCTKSQLNEILNRVSSGAREIFSDKLASVILFGSYARGDFDEDSDIDIFLLVNISASQLSKYRSQLDSLSGNLLYDFGIVVSILEKDTETYNKYAEILPFYRNIAKEGIKIA